MLVELWATLRVMPKTTNDNWLEMGPTLYTSPRRTGCMREVRLARTTLLTGWVNPRFASLRMSLSWGRRHAIYSNLSIAWSGTLNKPLRPVRFVYRDVQCRMAMRAVGSWPWFKPVEHPRPIQAGGLGEVFSVGVSTVIWSKSMEPSIDNSFLGWLEMGWPAHKERTAGL